MTIDFRQFRENMVEQQVRPWEVVDTRVLGTINSVAREAFVGDAYKALAYTDTALPIGEGEYMMKPVIEGRVLQALQVQAHERVLEIGTGSGYLTACLARLGAHVTSLELHPALSTQAAQALKSQDIGNVALEVGDALDWQTDQTFDVICVTGAVHVLPSQWLRWLGGNGRLLVVRGVAPVQEAVLVHADGREASLFETELPYLRGAAPAPTFKFE